jgi:excisionase family DNA binding protein
MTHLHDPLLTVEEVGELLGTGPDLPRRLALDGQLDHVQDGDGLRIPQSAVIAYAISTEGRPSSSATTSTDCAA